VPVAAPGLPMLMGDRRISEGGWIKRKGVTWFNLYRPPMVTQGDPAKAGRWLDHMARVFGAYADHIKKWPAHRVQRPADKINQRPRSRWCSRYWQRYAAGAGEAGDWTVELSASQTPSQQI
jgi:hypothetical protein